MNNETTLANASDPITIAAGAPDSLLECLLVMVQAYGGTLSHKAANLAIAFHDIQNLSRQLGFLDQHQLSIEKAREAYRKQFDIGQRTLLDLLDTENEYFQARRAYTNATYEYAIAHARTLAGMGVLLSALQVSREGLPTAHELGQDRFEVDADSQCPAEAPYVATFEVTQNRQPIAPSLLNLPPSDPSVLPPKQPPLPASPK